MVDTICIAGKNNIAVDIAQFLRSHYPDIKVIAIHNKNDHGINNFQKSFRRYCQNNNIQLVDLSNVYEVDNLLFLSLEFDKIIAPEKFATKNLFNIHFSALPEYKGMYTSALPLIDGKTYSGVTLHRIDKGIDTGNIIAQTIFDIKDETSQDLYLKYIEEGTKLVKSNMSAIIAGSFEEKEQPVVPSTYFSKKAIDYKNLVINLNLTAWQIYNQVRAFIFPAYQLPEVFGHFIYKCAVSTRKSTEKPGKIIFEDDFKIHITSIDYEVILFKDRKEKLFDAFKNGDANTVIEFVENEYDIFQRTAEGWDGLIVSAYNGQFEMVKMLIEKFNWNPNTINYNGTSFAMYAMTHASTTGNLVTLEYIRNSCSEINWAHKDYDGLDILHYARKYKNPKVIEFLTK